MDTRGPLTHKRDTVRRFSIAANPWPDEEQKRTPDSISEQHMGRRGRTLVIHARSNHPIILKSPGSSRSASPNPAGPGFTLQELVSLLVDMEEEKRETFQNAFLLLHQMFVLSSSLLDLLAGLYKQQPNLPFKMKVVMLIQKWLSLYPEDFVDMKMRFKLRAIVLERIQILGTSNEFAALREELRATLRLSEQVHVAIRPPSYYVEQNIKQIEAAHSKEKPKSRESPDRGALERSQSLASHPSPPDGLVRVRSNGISNSSLELKSKGMERVRSHGALDRINSGTIPEPTSEANRIDGPLEVGRSNSGERPIGSIHDTLKAQHYDPFSDTIHHQDDEDTTDEPDPVKLASPFSPRPLTISEPKTNCGRHWKGSDFLFDLSPAKVCAAFTVLDHINLRAIKLRELSNKQWTRPDALTKAPNVIAMVDQYNARSYWVAAEILLLHDQAQRVKAIRFFIDLAQECANARNYFSVFSIIHGLNQSPLFRLQADWEKLPKSSKACLSNLKATITEPSNNFKVYKAIKHQAQIPHLAYYTKLCFVYDELPLYLGPEQKINWDKKLVAIYNVLEEFQSCQKQELKIGQDSSLLELLGRLTRAVHYAATSIKFDAMWTLSFQYLPKPGRDANVIPLENNVVNRKLAVPTDSQRTVD